MRFFFISYLHKIKRKNDHCLGSLLCECTLHIFYSPHFFFKAAKATLCLPCFLCKVGPPRISVKEEEEEWVELVPVLVFETSSCNKRAREGRCSKNSSQPSEEIAVGRELLSRNVLTFSSFSCFLFPPLHRRDRHHPHHCDFREETN